MARHTLRGQVDASATKRLIVDDGDLTSGHRVTQFHVFATNTTLGDDPAAILGLQTNMGGNWDAGDNRQIGWAAQKTSPSQDLQTFSLLDPDHIIIRDLYIYNYTGVVLNYLIVIEPVNLSDDEAVLQLIKERSQNDLR
jgi:hypothetical protein